MIFNEKNHDFSQKKQLIGFLEPKISIWIGLQRDGRDTRAFADGRTAPGAPKAPGAEPHAVVGIEALGMQGFEHNNWDWDVIFIWFFYHFSIFFNWLTYWFVEFYWFFSCSSATKSRIFLRSSQHGLMVFFWGISHVAFITLAIR